MAKETILRKRLVSEGHLPKKLGWYDTSLGQLKFNGKFSLADNFQKFPEWWLEEVSAHVLSDDELKTEMLNLLCYVRDSYFQNMSVEMIYESYQTTKQDEPIR